MEMVWAFLKGCVNEKPRFQLKYIKNLLMKANDIFTSDMWSIYVKRVQKVIEQDWSSDGLDQRSVHHEVNIRK